MEVEKALRIINKGDPVEASDLIRSLEQVTKNPNQLNSTDVLRLYLLLLDRLFSEEVTKGGSDAASTSSGSQLPGSASASSTTSAPQNVWIKGSLGGWLRTFIQQNANSSNSLTSATTSLLASADNAKNASMSNFSTLMQRPVAPSTGSSTSSSSNASNSSAALPVGVKLIQQLFMTSPLIRLVDEYQTHLQWNVNFLPHKLTALLTNRPSALVIEDYAAHMLVQEFHRSLKATSSGSMIELNAFQYFLFVLVRYATMSSQYMNKQVQTVSSGGYSPPVSPSEQLIQRGVTAWTQSVPYLALVQQYMRDFLISNEDSPKHVQGRHTLFLLFIESWMDVEILQRYDYAHTAYLQRLLMGGDPAGTSNGAASNGHNNSSDWYNNGHGANSNNNSSQRRFYGGNSGINGSQGNESTAFVAPHPTKPVILSPNGTTSTSTTLKWTVGMQQGTYLYLHLLFSHVSNIQEELRRLAHNQIDLTVPTPPVHHSHAHVFSPATGTAANANANHASPPPALAVHPRSHAQPLLHRTWTQLQHLSGRYLELRHLFDQLHLVQLPVYAMLMAVFTRCEQLVSFDREVLALTVEIWVLWLQPWKTIRTFLPESDAETRRSAIRLYMAHNLHFYTTLLVVFLRLMTKINLTACSEGQKNVALLGRVLEVYTADVVDHLRSLSTGFVQWMERVQGAGMTPAHGGVIAQRSAATSSVSGSGSGRVRFDGSHSHSRDWQTSTPVTPRHRSASSVGLTSISNEEIKLIKQHHVQCYPDEHVWALPDFGITVLDDHVYDALYTIYYRNIFTAADASSMTGPRASGGLDLEMAGKVLQDFFSDVFGLDRSPESFFRGLDSLLDAGRVTGGAATATSTTAAAAAAAAATTATAAASSTAAITGPLTTNTMIRQRIVELAPRITQAHRREDSQSPASTLLHPAAGADPDQQALASLLASLVAASHVSPQTAQVYLELRNNVDGKLKIGVRDSVSQGRWKMKPTQIADAALVYRQSSDPLDLPMCSHELPWLARWCVQGSKQLNLLAQLPQHRHWLRVSWPRLLDLQRLAVQVTRRLRTCEQLRQRHAMATSASASATAVGAGVVALRTESGEDAVLAAVEEIGQLRTLLAELPPADTLTLVRHVFRFNLRVLASYRVFGSLALGLLFLAARLTLLSDSTAALVALPFLWLVVRGAFPEYVIR